MLYKKQLCCLFLLFFIFTSPQASEKHCSLIEERDKRESCYAQQAPEKTRDWLVLESKQLKSTSVSNSAIRKVMCGEVLGSTSLVFSCKEGNTSLLVSTSCVMGTKGDTNDIEFHINGAETNIETFVVPNNKRALSMKDEESSKRIIKSFLGHDQLDVKITPPSHQAFTATFNIKNLEDKMVSLRKSCQW